MKRDYSVLTHIKYLSNFSGQKSLISNETFTSWKFKIRLFFLFIIEINILQIISSNKYWTVVYGIIAIRHSCICLLFACLKFIVQLENFSLI